MSGDRLAFLPGATEFVARRGGRPMPRAAFLAEIAACAAWLPDRPYLINFCADRVRFTVLWAAAMLRGQITLLPGEGSAAAVAALLADYPGVYAVTDSGGPDGLPCESFAFPDLGPGPEPADALAFPPEQIAAVLFTSGSTGKPQPTQRSWGRLVHASRAAGRALGIAEHAGAAVVATVPHAHSYGLESAVMLPLQHGLLLDDTRPFYPADVALALAREQPAVLVTTPVHLRALVKDPAVEMRAALVLSATAPLAPELAAVAERTFAAPVFEIYGCSEAGQLASRRTVDGPSWRVLDGFGVRSDAAGTWVGGPAEPDTLLADDLACADGGSFVLRGRNADGVNVAGKRTSIAYLTARLLEIEGVVDGVFVQPDEVAPGGTARVAALVVAPGLEVTAILAALRDRIDAAFLPRPLRLIDALPRNALGKLPRTDVLRLLASPAEPAVVRVSFATDHPTAAGHFPGNPIIPGAVLLDTLLPALAPDARALDAVKFHHPVRPGDTVAITSTLSGATTRFEARLEGSGVLVLSGAVRSPSPTP
jgi:acyl-CoA synthetase (AMP-forming)/AMP-acid ligase II